MEKEKWQNQDSGLTRRKVLQIGAGIAAAGALGTLLRTDTSYAQEAPPPHVKPTPPELFIDFGLNKEARLENIKGLITPNQQFFIRNHHPTPRIDAKTWKLKVEGNAVSKTLELTYDDLLRLPFKSVVTWVECAGNGRGFFGMYHGKPASGTQWRLGAIGLSEWTGVPLSLILDAAGVKKDAMDVLIEGLDEGKVSRPIPIEKALDSNTILAYAMNGEFLPPDHGFPVRAITPGWVGINNTKWVGRIEVQNTKILVRTNTTAYILEGDAYPTKIPLDLQNIKSAVALPWDGTVPEGPRLIRGFAWCSRAPIASVEYSLDGDNWRKAELVGPRDQLLWTRWYFTADLKPGRHYVATRATDEKGNTQPAQLVPFNNQGYLYNTIVSHPFNVI